MHDEAMTAVAAHIKNLLRRVRSAMIMISDPVDPDCVAAALALRWILAQQHTQAAIVSRYRIPATMLDFPGIRHVEVHDVLLPDFASFEAYVLVDGSTWSQFLGQDWQQVLAGLDLRRLINIDHHESDDIRAALPRTCLNVQLSSTVQVIYEYLIRPAGRRFPVEIADVLYRALLYDSRNFKNEMHPGEYAFAAALIDQGADHARAVDVNVDMREVRFMCWAVEHTEFIQDLCLSMLCIDAGRRRELEARFGTNWSDFNSMYKETVLRQVSGFHYGVILQEQPSRGTVRLTWRTRNYGDHLAIADVARRAGFKAGGHRNAGGGSSEGPLSEARMRLLAEFRRALTGA